MKTPTSTDADADDDTPLPAWSSPADLARWLKVPTRTVYSWQHAGTGPRFHRVGRHVRYRSDDVDVWLADRAVGGDAA